MSVLDYVLSLGTVVSADAQDVVDDGYNQIFDKILAELQNYVPIRTIHRTPHAVYDRTELPEYLASNNRMASLITQSDVVLTPETYPQLARDDRRIYNVVCSRIYRGTTWNETSQVYLVRGPNHVCCFCILGNDEDGHQLYYFDSSYDEDKPYLESFLLCHPQLIGMPVNHVFEYDFQAMGDSAGFHDVFCRLWTTYFIHSIFVMGRTVEDTVERLEEDRVSCMREILMYIYADEETRPHELLS